MRSIPAVEDNKRAFSKSFLEHGWRLAGLTKVKSGWFESAFLVERVKDPM